MRAVSVAVPVPGLDLLTYLVPDSFELPSVGARVLVPLGSRVVTGCVFSVDPNCPTPSDVASPPDSSGLSLKSIIDVLDDGPFFPPTVIDLAAWLAEYYACGPGDAIGAAAPPFAWVESERAVRITADGQAIITCADETLFEDAKLVLRLLREGDPLPLRVLRERVKKIVGQDDTVAVQSTLRALERKGLVTSEQTLRGSADRSKTRRVAAITVGGLEGLATDLPSRSEANSEAVAQSRDGRRLTDKQREALSMLQGAPEGLPLSTLADRGISSDTIARLSTRGLVTIRNERLERDPFAAEEINPGLISPVPGGEMNPGLISSGLGPEINPGFISPVSLREINPGLISSARVLTAEQSAALDLLGNVTSEGKFRVALLHGVTGSGKTEIYLQLAARVCAAGKSVLLMVPEIALTPALTRLVRQAFGDRVAVQHSGLSDGERHDQWQRIKRGEIQLVVGTRSAVFAPLSNLGLIVVDEEHDGSYKQEETPRYNGRDVAVMRAKRENAAVVLGSATPSMETYQNAMAGRYEHIVMKHRVLERPLAAVRVVNMRDEYAKQGPDVVLSDVLREAIEDRLAKHEQVLVLLNRRGFATAAFCRQCGNTIDCPNCSVSLTVHGKEHRRGRCHYCNYSALLPKSCPSCAAPYVEHRGVGTEQLEQIAAGLFPTARIGRLDRDVASRRGATVSLLSRFGAGELDLLIGTQMIAKGHDFPRVTLVGVISADVGLGLPDFRAAERTFQLLTQVVGRAGRGEQPGEAIIQTLFPEHYSVRLGCDQNYPAFFEEEIRFRRAMHYPPHVSLVNAIVRGPSLQSAMEEANDLVARVRNAGAGRFRVIGPAPAAFTKLRGEHRTQFFLKGTARTAMRQALQSALAARPDLRRRVTIDVDPLSVL